MHRTVKYITNQGEEQIDLTPDTELVAIDACMLSDSCTVQPGDKLTRFREHELDGVVAVYLHSSRYDEPVKRKVYLRNLKTWMDSGQIQPR